MAKCVGSVSQWSPKIINIENADYLIADNPRQGENALKDRVERKSCRLLLDIASDFIKIKQSALYDEEFKLDCGQVQEALVIKLNALYSETASVIRSITSSSLTQTTKIRYFMQYTYGYIEKFQQLLQIVGRLSDIDQKLYSEEQRKLLISDESITIHSMTSIWTAILEILNDVCQIAAKTFDSSPNDDDEDFDDQDESKFSDTLESSSERLNIAKILLMDLIITSWIKFNRLVKYDDLVKSIPFLCPCHMKLFFRTLDGMTAANLQVLNNLLGSVLDYECEPSLMTNSSRRPGIIPMEPCYANSNQACLAYFIIWHLYSLCTRIKEPIKQSMILNCKGIFEKSFIIVQESFLANLTTRRLSPHQEERYKLLFHMLNVWCETHQQNPANNNAIILCHLFKFAQTLDSLPNLETKYFDNPNFTVNGLTLFQLCTKLFNEAVPMYTKNCQLTDANANSGQIYTSEQSELIKIWNTMIDKIVQTQPSLVGRTNEAIAINI